MEAPTIETTYKDFSADYVAIATGNNSYLTSSGLIARGCFLGAVVLGILAKSPVSRSAGYVRYNGVSAVLSRHSVGGAAVNEANIDLMHSKKFITLRTITGSTGFYITMDNTFAPTGSDFVDLRTVCTVFKAVRECRSAMLPYLLADFPSSGFDLEAAMKNLEATGVAPLNRMIANGEISAAVVQIPLGQDFIGSGRIKVNVSIVPRFIAKFINMQFSLLNPGQGGVNAN